jgi:hypothetical protein
MKKASEYREHAEECRNMARGLPEGEHRTQLLEMARTWDNLAKEREDKLMKDAASSAPKQDQQA